MADMERKVNKEATRIKAPAVTQSTQQQARPPPPRKSRMPLLPFDDIKTVYRPQALLELDWKSFRDNLGGNTAIDDIDHWLKGLLITAEQHKNIHISTNSPAFDPHLLHLWEANRSLLRRWKREKLNRKLKQRIALLTIQAQDNTEQVIRQNWHTFCDNLQGTLSIKKTWHFLRALLATDRTKTQRQDLRRLIHNHTGLEHDLLRELQQKLRSDKPTSSACGKAYDGAPNPDLDRPFTQAELHAALAKLTRNTSTGKDRIANKLLSNLPESVATALLQYYNDCWEEGDLPAAWKHSEVTMIPKPNKTPWHRKPPSHLPHVLRGQLLKHIVHDRLSPYLEDNGYFPHTMFGFRQHLSTQVIPLLLLLDYLD
ncbi:uncharacterized protein LOC125943442 [Dermacentor silvarum]|uniref:uncharacterized protein LOC125943442 n=1 Tax=Dermacentor silvarum TaxID=543639 RepID=UPI00210192C1|nr:uncharacterized protein LOC125943442 [Dermacentor silvarum]